MQGGHSVNNAMKSYVIILPFSMLVKYISILILVCPFIASLEPPCCLVSFENSHKVLFVQPLLLLWWRYNLWL